ncbi:unnamed protein product [Rotaria sp. Silwood2]|nr:unnamed protein product [Rotaria sp. Silwood2]CAF4045178.1 unnamed protein product [Rotaria sp. Silwood2]
MMGTLLTSSSYVDFSNVTININKTTTTTSTMPVGIRIVTLTCMILIDISAFLGNLLVICAFFRTRRLQTVTNYFIASLAFADALVAIFVLPLSIYYNQRDRSWKLGLILCDLWVSSDVLLCTSSILNLTCISVDRYMAITKPLTYTAYRSKFLARVMILLVWIVSVVITCPPIFGWRDKNRRQTVEQQYKCDLNTARGYVVYSALGSFYIPGVVMIFVYIRIFMVVYDRENLIKNFRNNNNSNNNTRSSNLSIKSNPNSCITNTHISNNKKQDQNFSSWCCFCFRRESKENLSSRTSAPHYSYNCCPTIEQKQNGYLIYRFTNNNNSNPNPNANSNINTNSPVHTRRLSAKTSIFSRSCKNPTKKLSNISDDIYQSRCNCSTHISSEYQFREDDSSSYELQTYEKTVTPLIKRRSRSFEHSTISKIRDLNTELSHSRQLKAAAVAAAAISTTTNTKDTIKQENEIGQIRLSAKENNTDHLFSSINENLNKTSQSLNELTQLSIKQNKPTHKQRSMQQINSIPMRTRSTTNPAIMQKNLSNNSAYPYCMRQKQSLPEPTRINRRIKSSRLLKTSPSALSIENIKQQYGLTNNNNNNNTSIQSTKSFSSIIRHCINRNNNLNENNLNQNHSLCYYCCFYSSSINNNTYQNRTKQTYTVTPSHSFTNDDDDDDDKLSLNEIANRTPIYTPGQSSSLTCTSVRSNTTPGDVHRRERIRFMKEQKTAKTLAVVVGGFIILWLPFFIMYVIPPEKRSLNDHTVTLITWLGYFNSVINPFIYAYCSKQFRMAFWNITFGVCIKKSSALLPISNKNKQLHQRRINA